jgi:hypothetical protein
MENLTGLTGHYFPYCQFCEHDGNCELRHNEFLGLNSQGKVDKSRYPGHEDLTWHFSAFQGNRRRGTCAGRIMKSGSIFIPLVCECGTAISSLTFSYLFGIDSFCRKFRPNEKGKQRKKLAEKIAKKKDISIEKIKPEDLPEPEPYDSVMQR